MRNEQGEEMEPTIFVNGSRIYLNEDYLTGTTGLVVNESIIEQCENCGRDIIEYGRVSLDGKSVVCAICQTKYEIQWRLCRYC